MFARPRRNDALAALVAAAATGVSAQPVQQQEPASELYLDVSSGLYSYDNYESLKEAEGTTRLWTSDLTLGFDNETAVEKLSFRAGGRFEAGDFAEHPDRTNQWKNVFTVMDYNRVSKNAYFQSNLSYRETDNGINLERDFETSSDLIVDQGTRSDAHAQFELGIGQGTPTWMATELSYHRRRYFDTTDGDLSDQDTIRFYGELGLGITRSASLLLTTSYRDRDDIDNINDDETHYSFGVGIQADLRPDLSFRGVLRYERDEITDNSIDGDTDVEDGPTLDLSFRQDRPNGTLRFGLLGERDRNGLRTTVNVGRAMELPHGAVDFSFGVTSLEDGDIAPVWALMWQRDYRTRRITLNYNTSVFSDDDGSEIIRNRLGFALTQELTRFDGLELSVNFASADNFDSGDSEYRQAAANIQYYKEINRDLSFVTGYRHSLYDRAEDDTVTENEIFARIDKRFSLRP